MIAKYGLLGRLQKKGSSRQNQGIQRTETYNRGGGDTTGSATGCYNSSIVHGMGKREENNENPLHSCCIPLTAPQNLANWLHGATLCNSECIQACGCHWGIRGIVVCVQDDGSFDRSRSRSSGICFACRSSI